MLFYAAVFFVIQFTACFQQEHGTDEEDSIYDGMTDGESLVKQNEYLVKSVRNLENLNIRQQQDIDNLQTTVRKQQRQLRLIDRMLVSRSQASHDVQEMSKTTESPERKGGSHVIPKVGVQSSGKRVVAKTGQAVRNGFEGQMRSTRQSETVQKVAFFATASNHISNLGAGQILEFNHVVTNIGNAYSGSTGIFTAPFPGTYVFSASLMGLSSDNHHYYVAKNHVAVSRLHVSAQNPYSTTTHTVILVLKQGDDVEIRSNDSGRAIYGLDYTCFSGFLLYEDESSGTTVG